MSMMISGFEPSGGVLGGCKTTLNYARDVDRMMKVRVFNSLAIWKEQKEEIKGLIILKMMK